MSNPTRREFVAAAAAAVHAAPVIGGASSAVSAEVESDLARYIGFGIKASGGAGDTATGAWLESELKAAGFSAERLPFSVPYFNIDRAELVTGSSVATLIPQAMVQTTPSEGIKGRLVKIAFGDAIGSLDGAIALVDLPSQRWSSALANALRNSVTAAIAAGAAG